MEDLRLEVADFDSSAEGLAWRWVLTEPGGALVADHQVRLDRGEPGYEAFTDLYGYLRWRADPEDRVASEAALVAAAGRWIGERVFGAVGSALAARAPAVVRVIVPGPARVVAFRPLELAVVGGRSLAAQGASERHERTAAISRNCSNARGTRCGARPWTRWWMTRRKTRQD